MLRMGIHDMPEYGKHIGGRKITKIPDTMTLTNSTSKWELLVEQKLQKSWEKMSMLFNKCMYNRDKIHIA